MRRLASLLTLLVGACAREPIADPAPGSTLPDAGRASPDVAEVGDVAQDEVAQDRTGSDDSVAPPPDRSSPADSSAPDPDVGGPDLAPLDVFDVGRASDGRLSDRCGSLYRATIPVAIETIAADDAGNADATDARPMDVADGRDTDRILDADARDATFDEVCYALTEEFRAFVKQNNACTVASDCVIVFGVRSCSCSPRGIADGSGVGVASSASTAAENYVARWSAAGCESWGGLCDARPSDRVDCIQGKCVANQPNCYVPPPEPRPEPCQ